MSAVDAVARGRAQQALLNPNFLKGAAFAERIRILAGPGDSLTEGAGGSTWRSTFAAHAKNVLGDGGPGLTDCQRNGDPDYSFGIGNGMSYISALAWSNALRQKSFFGRGLYTTAATNGYFSANPAVETNVVGFRLIAELRSDDASFRWRVNSSHETGGTADTVSVAGGYAKNVLLDLFRPFTAGVGGAKGMLIDQVVGDCSFHALEPVRSTPGVTLTNLGIGGAKAADFAQLDDTRTREFLRLINADVALINLGMNDRIADKAFTYGKNLSAIVDRFKAVPTTNVILIRPNDSSDAGSTNLQYYTDVIRSIANSRGCGFVDMRDALGPYATANAAGDMYDGVHLSAQGNAKADRAIRKELGI